MQFLEGKNVPSRYLNSDDQPNQTISMEFLQYQQQLIVVWLVASMTYFVLIKMGKFTLFTRIWFRLETYYASHTPVKIKRIKLQLKTPKYDRFISSYLLDTKKSVDTLATMGAPVSMENHIDNILDGLSEDNDSFITAITSRTDPCIVDEIEALLLPQEERFD